MLRASQLFTAHDLSYDALENNVDMLFPHGVRVGVDAGYIFDDENDDGLNNDNNNN